MKKMTVERIKAIQALEEAWKNIGDKTISPPAT
jgi:hypothetical protein